MVKLQFTVPGMSERDASKVADLLQERLVALIDLQLTLKHVHWNVVGPNFIGVHEMLDPQVDGVRMMVDRIAERIATLGAAPNGLPGNLVRTRAWDDYSIGRADVLAHLGALDLVYSGVVEGHRNAIDELEDPDKVSQDILIGQSGELEQYHWFVRAHLEAASGELMTRSATTERQAASMAAGNGTKRAAKRQSARNPRTSRARSTARG